MDVEHGVMGEVPFAAIGSGPTVVVLPGLSPMTGVDSDSFIRTSLAPVRGLADRRRLVVLNRRPGLPTGMTMADIAREHADAVRSASDQPVDLVGLSTGGSIAQQLAADHPDVVRRLVLISTACRLGDHGRDLQAQVGVALRAGETRQAAALAATALAPKGLGFLGQGVGWLAARRIIPSAAAAADLATTIEAEDAFDLVRCAQPIEAKTLIVGGGQDKFYSRALFEETAALIPDSQLQVFPKRGHITVTSDKRARPTIAGFLLWEG